MMKISLTALNNATVITHPAPHHGDETTAIAILEIVNGRVDVYRTRKPNEIEEAASNGAVICDVGGVYDPETNRFDHHQKDFGEMREDSTMYSSAGLVWRKYGADACIALTGCTQAQAEEAAAKVDEMLIKGIDAIDNGQTAGNGVMSVSQAISVLNPNWNEPATDEHFLEACKLAHTVLTRTIKSCVATVMGRDTVEEAINASEDGIMVLPCYINSWQETVLQSANPKAKDVLYGVFRNLQGKHTVMAVPPSLEEGMKQRKPLPEGWGGASRDELQRLTGVADVIFCHPQRFTCGAESLEGAIQLAHLAVADGCRTYPCDEQAVEEENAGMALLQ